MGTSLAPTVTDDDLDRHVAELILREAKQKAEKYGQDGIRAYLQSNYNESNAPKANKRFLSSIIKNTDDHNKTIMRAQAQAAQEIRLEREEQERRERRARAEEAVAAERMRRLMGQGGRTEWASNWDRGGSKDRKRRERSWDRRDGYGDEGSEREHKRERRSDRPERERRHRHRPMSGERRSRREERRSGRSRSRDRHDEEDEGKSHRRSRRRHRGDRSRSRPGACSENETDDRDHDKRRRRHREATTSTRKERRTSPSERSRPHSPDADRPSRSRRHSLSPARSDSSQRHHSQRSRDDAQDDAGDAPSREDQLRLELKRKGKAKATVDLPGSHTRRSSPSSRSSVARAAKSRTPDKVPSKPGSPSSPTLRSSASAARSSPGPPLPPTSPPPLPPPPPVPSKMDKYFESSYDPRLDVAPLAVPTVPKTGLIDDADFAGWDAMLEVIRQQREYKAEKKILERWNIGKEKDKSKKSLVSATAAWSEGGSNVMDIQYKKKGSVREWDVGKEGF